jgi:hypothetical protein
LKNKVTKANAQKVLQSLAGKLRAGPNVRKPVDPGATSALDKGDLTLKMYGKQSIFVYNQVSCSQA